MNLIKEGENMKKSVLITGVSGGIGKAVAKKFAENGYDIIATYNSNGIEENLQQFCADKGVNLMPIKMDISSYEEVDKAFDKAFKENSYVDAVVCNAGVCLSEKLLCDCSSEEIDKLVDVNLKGTIYCNSQAMKHFMKIRRGSIVNISSIYGMHGGACEAVYSACKGGINALTKALADECASFGVRVNAVAPGFIQTNMTSCFSEEEKRAIAESTPLKRLGNAEDVANAVYFLASDDASFITGEIITVSGGAETYC